MVHALKEIQRLLKPDGILVDIHPIPKLGSIEVYQGDKLLFAEQEQDTRSEDEIHADVINAEKALAQVVKQGLYAVDQAHEFDFLIYASSVGELIAHWEELWAYEDQPEEEDLSLMDENLSAKVEEIMHSSGAGAEVAVNARALISRLRPIR